MPATRYRLPLPQRLVLLFFPVAGSGFLVIHRSSMYPGMRAPVRSDLAHGLRTVIDDLAAVQLEPAPAAEEIGDDGVERGGELLGALVRVDVHAEDGFVFGQDGALRESGQQHVPNAHRSVWGGAGNYLVAPELEPVGAVEQVVDLYVELP